ncbi:nucleotidyltransferase family protein [Bradyrhizobium sp. SSUT112]|uniref:nucleotidyltransferase family protein n=1 Tax=Bradyrhizobium sp. SSUT112 TaxID=3040604 RepID=UPI00244AA6F8|nr:nucleotidyltransferase family protein [Bradyrhizobium sp. SSUT112]MDH2351079.1 nucleotidyltransferase family protein [Bradyrhizobium sp. SSUT112]
MDRDRFLALALLNPVNVAIIDELHRFALPDAWLVSGCLVQTAWNVLTGRTVDYGIADCDVFYLDPDTSWEAEDAVIRALHARLGHLGVKIEARNQARVHLWYPDKHGLPYPPLTCSTDGIDRFLMQNTQVGVRRAGDRYEVYAPHGFDDIAGLIARPNLTRNFSAANYAAKTERWKTLWPEITVIATEWDAVGWILVSEA